MAQEIYATITRQIAEEIRSGTANYEMPWHCDTTSGRPINALTRKHYSGVNVLTLWSAARRKGYAEGEWATYKQWIELGAHVRKKEKGTVSVFYKRYRREDVDPATHESVQKDTYVARASWLFNAAQVDGYAVAQPRRRSLVEVLRQAETFVGALNADIRIGGAEACYHPRSDYVQMPDQDRFRDTKTGTATEHYYSVLFHELTHWSGHPSRLDRDLSGRFGGERYALEELVAELGAAFLCADQQVTNSPRLDHARYIGGWLEALERDLQAIFVASRKASQAAAFLNERAGRGGADE